MLQLVSYFEGHRGAVLSLAASTEENCFYSSGAEGLIVKWQRDTLNEGQVLLKLSGYISAIAFDNTTKKMYAAVNHKGVYVIDTTTRTVLKTLDMPHASFGDLKIISNHIIITTKDGDIIIVDKGTLKFTKIISTGLNDFSQLAVNQNIVYYSVTKAVNQINLTAINQKEASFQLNKKPMAISLAGDCLVALTDTSIISWHLYKRKAKQELINTDDVFFKLLYTDYSTKNVFALSDANYLYKYQLNNKSTEFVEKIQIEHNGQINDLLWIENHKFVVSAGADKKIGIWQVN